MPALDTLLLSHNRLTDCSLGPLCEMAHAIPWLTALDLSGNDMDESSTALRHYLLEPSCRLQRLWLSHADIDDFECADFMEAISSNTSLVLISLSDNLIGDAEILNIVNPELITGGEATVSADVPTHFGFLFFHHCIGRGASPNDRAPENQF